ncbi:MAG: hypothetical protein ACJ746_11835 [Bryobacteraceae bacterium]
MLNGGVTTISGVGMYTPSTLNSFAVMHNNAQVMEFGFYDQSGNISGSRYAKQ